VVHLHHLVWWYHRYRYLLSTWVATNASELGAGNMVMRVVDVHHNEVAMYEKQTEVQLHMVPRPAGSVHNACLCTGLS
jgi:hypothetical protein